jgi:hypothetical protein
VRVVAFRDMCPDEVPIEESPFFALSAGHEAYSAFVDRLTPAGGGKTPARGSSAGTS